nr:DUF1515 family protein [Rhizobium bangladeshense]
MGCSAITLLYPKHCISCTLGGHPPIRPSHTNRCVASGSSCERSLPLGASCAAAQEDIAEMRPVTDDVRRWKLMGWARSASSG